ncbi:AAA family ATPase [Tumidithrix elongata RA019]|uniref:AAA family ATPase n=1 Tax=Tumidithrix elongata BACA0141 TaxID=2716417 RepID=A0AAW9Q3S1_9CYAN|nr:AAA family ATPase [Tumidithrix elongata RA019]
MHIQQVTVKNFRCFDDLIVNLNPDVNIFVGNNGSGKSAVLDAIAAAISPYLYEFQDIVDVRSRSKDIEETYLFQRDLQVKQEGNSSININRIELGHVNSDMSISYSVQYFKRSTDNNNIDLRLDRIDKSSIRRDINRYLQASSNINCFPIVAYYRGNRNLKDISDVNDFFNREFDIFDALKNSLDATANFAEFTNWFFAREFQELKEGKKRGDVNFELPELKQVRKAISIIVAPNARVYFSQTNSTKLMVEWETEIGEKIELSLSQLSSGYRNMLALVMDFSRRLAQANPEMENPLEAEAVLMIDELDLHLHPTWQQKIIPDLRKVFPNTQIIATTHSPEIVTTVERHQVKILEDYQIKECPSPTKGMKSSDIVRYVLGLENLRPDTEESRTLTALFNAIDRGNLEEAKQLREKLRDWEQFDPDMTRADMQIRRLERKITA